MPRLYVFLRRGDTPVEEFRRYYLEEHAPFATEQVPNKTKYRVEFPDDPASQPYDSNAVLEFETLEDLNEALESEQTAEVVADIENFADPDETLMMTVAEEHIFVE